MTFNLYQCAEPHLLERQLRHYTSSYSQAIVITDDTVGALISWDFPQVRVPSGEEAKTLSQAEVLWGRLAELKADRQSILLAVGGGALLDFVGFVASTYMRGIATVNVPTTLLAMVDAAIGGKNALNVGGIKNLVGTFHQPQAVWLAPFFLETLPQREYASGMAEVVKYGVIRDLELFERLEGGTPVADLIYRCAELKAAIVGEDPHDHGIRATLNYGHTVGHALEALTDYGHFLHGEAVAIGMSCAAYISLALDMTSEDVYKRQDTLLQMFKLPTLLPPGIDIDALIYCMERDKKAEQGKINLILVEQIGKVLRVPDLDKKFLKEALEAKVAHEQTAYAKN